MVLTCKDNLELLREYVEDELPSDVRERLEDHLGGCGACWQFVHSYRLTPHLCREAMKAEVPEEVAASLTEFLRKEMGKSGQEQ